MKSNKTQLDAEKNITDSKDKMKHERERNKALNDASHVIMHAKKTQNAIVLSRYRDDVILCNILRYPNHCRLIWYGGDMK